MLSFSWAWLPAILRHWDGPLGHSVPRVSRPRVLAGLPFLLIWGVGFVAHDPAEEIRRTKRHRFFGPGGPDDPFANDPYDD
jgi:hypothetical protein